MEWEKSMVCMDQWWLLKLRDGVKVCQAVTKYSMDGLSEFNEIIGAA